MTITGEPRDPFARRPLGLTDPFTPPSPKDPFQDRAQIPSSGPALVRAFFINEEAGETLQVLLNPTTFTEEVTALYARQPVLGLSHEVLQYTRTKTLEIPLQLYVSHYEMARQGVTDRSPLDYRNFFLGLVYPIEGGRAPSVVTFVWPSTTIIRGVITSLKFNYQKFSQRTGQPLIYTIDLKLVEHRASLRASPIARRQGFLDPDAIVANLLEIPPELATTSSVG